MRLRSTAALCSPCRISSSIAKAESRGYAMLPFKLVYHPRYDLNLGAHVFPSQKYRLIRERLLQDRTAEPDDFVEPEAATDSDVLLGHGHGWVERLKSGTLTMSEMMALEIPYSEAMVHAFWLAAGGTILAARNAVEG